MLKVSFSFDLADNRAFIDVVAERKRARALRNIIREEESVTQMFKTHRTSGFSGVLNQNSHRSSVRTMSGKMISGSIRLAENNNSDYEQLIDKMDKLAETLVKSQRTYRLSYANDFIDSPRKADVKEKCDISDNMSWQYEPI